MMLPSGNDAAHALACFFGSRLEDDGRTPYKRFVRAMNRKCTDLNLSGFKINNPHGLVKGGNIASAEAVCKITHEGMKHELF